MSLKQAEMSSHLTVLYPLVIPARLAAQISCRALLARPCLRFKREILCLAAFLSQPTGVFSPLGLTLPLLASVARLGQACSGSLIALLSDPALSFRTRAHLWLPSRLRLLAPFPL